MLALAEQMSILLLEQVSYYHTVKNRHREITNVTENYNIFMKSQLFMQNHKRSNEITNGHMKSQQKANNKSQQNKTSRMKCL